MADGRQLGQAASDKAWPVVKKNARDDRTYKVEEELKTSKGNRWVTVRPQGEKARLFADTESRYTLIPLEMYKQSLF